MRAFLNIVVCATRWKKYS